MYYLSKFCRICVQTGVKLLDLDTLDFDEVKLSEKLEVCTKMGYLEALLCASNDQKSNNKNFINADLSVIVTPVTDNVYNPVNEGNNNDNDSNNYREKRKRITKEQRCSLLKRLLTPTDKFKKERDKYPYKHYYLNNFKGGLKNIISFTKNYEFGFKLDKNSNYESTPLDKLTAFSNDFFRKDFSEFRNTILYIIENKDNLYESGDSEDEDLFLNCPQEEDIKENLIKFEEVIVEPDIKIKTEMDFEDDDMDHYEEHHIEIVCKKEKEDHDMEPTLNHNCLSLPVSVPTNYSEYMRGFLQTVPSNSPVQLLDSLVGNYHHGQRRTFSQSNVRCRTRDNPYINPLLKDQFLYRCFKCEKCNRYFKSPGYLKAHYSKVH